MTQKELLYLEDGVKHEESIISYLQDSVDMLDSEELNSFIQKEIKKHEGIKEKLISELEECCNE